MESGPPSWPKRIGSWSLPRGDNAQEDRPLIAHATHLFESEGYWVDEEARADLAAASRFDSSCMAQLTFAGPAVQRNSNSQRAARAT